MVNRCLNPKNSAFPVYGLLGVCDRWREFPNFYADMGDPPAGTSIERVDNSRGYYPDNCCWADRTTQNRNRSNNRILTIDGLSQPVAAWAQQYGLKSQTVYARLYLGWPAEDAVKTPLVSRRVGIPRGQRVYRAANGVVFHDEPHASSETPPLAHAVQG